MSSTRKICRSSCEAFGLVLLVDDLSYALGVLALVQPFCSCAGCWCPYGDCFGSFSARSRNTDVLLVAH